MTIEAIADQIISELNSREDLVSLGGASKADEINENEVEFGVTVNTDGYLSALSASLQSQFAQHSLTYEESVKLAAVCFGKAFDLPESEAMELARNSVIKE